MPHPVPGISVEQVFRANLLELLEADIMTTLAAAGRAAGQIDAGDQTGAAASLVKVQSGHDDTVRWMDEAASRGISVAYLTPRFEQLSSAFAALRRRLRGTEA